jgi:predicted N-acetyltransferase YhbS
LPRSASVLDLGCGSGLPITKVLVDEGLDVHAIDAAPSMVAAFRANFPLTPVACEPVVDSSFFGRTFQAVIAWGLVFLLPPQEQCVLVRKIAAALVPGGRLLFTSPAEPLVWNDAMTELPSQSLGAAEYRALLSAAGVTVTSEYEDEGQNHYYDAIKDGADRLLRIRPETEADRAAVRAVNEAAFGTSAEADLVEALHGKPVALVSLVAEVADTVVGHILFSPVSLTGHAHLDVMGLGPMAVAPDHQRKGVGSALVRAGLAACKDLGCRAVVVVGHPAYYPRFGFVPAGRHALRCEYDVPADVFVVAELEAGALEGASGLVRYDEAFAGV